MVDGWRLFVPLWGQIDKFLVSGGQGPGARQVTTGPPPTLAPVQALTFAPTLPLAPTSKRGKARQEHQLWVSMSRESSSVDVNGWRLIDYTTHNICKYLVCWFTTIIRPHAYATMPMFIPSVSEVSRGCFAVCYDVAWRWWGGGIAPP